MYYRRKPRDRARPVFDGPDADLTRADKTALELVHADTATGFYPAE
jgi:hypothetical protein